MHQAQKLGGLKLSEEIQMRLHPEDDPDQCPQDLIDFSPVYRSLHIFSVLVSVKCVLLCLAAVEVVFCFALIFLFFHTALCHFC